MEYLSFNIMEDKEVLDFLMELYYNITPDKSAIQKEEVIRNKLTYLNGFPLIPKDAMYISELAYALAAGKPSNDEKEWICNIFRKVVWRATDCKFQISCELCPLNDSRNACRTSGDLCDPLSDEEKQILYKVLTIRGESTSNLDTIVTLKIQEYNPLKEVCRAEKLKPFVDNCYICGAYYSSMVNIKVKALYKSLAESPTSLFLLRPQSEGGLGLDKSEALTLARLFMKTGAITTAHQLKQLLIGG